MRLEHVMTREAVLVSPSDQIVDVARRMREQATSSVLVVDDQGILVGILTERDFVHKVVAEGLECKGLRVDEFMTRNPVTADPRARVWEGARLMSERRIRHLPVVSEGRPIGVVSRRDVAGMETEPKPFQHVFAGVAESSREQTVEVWSQSESDLGDILPAWY